ncbi:D-alanyl-D-alanine carboxypeptidase [Salinibacterium hongtaonis]|nr:D-alanyl-D-alanine carboxypeptidase [Salinibacterium hongtaonis]
MLIAGAYLPMTLLAPLSPTAAVVVETDAPVVPSAELAWPQSTAVGVAALGYPGMLASAGSTEALPMASLTKVVGALTILDAHPLDLGQSGPDITFTKQDVALYGSYQAAQATVKPVRSGLVLTQYETLQASLIPSAANYATSLAIWAFGSEKAFVEAAGEWLTKNGLAETTVTEPTGLDPRNTSTVADLVELGRLALSHPVVAEIVSTPAVTLPTAGLLENSNKILGSLGIDGIKTGTLPEAGACLLFSSDFVVGGATITIIGVALGGALHSVQNPQIMELVRTVQAGFTEITLATEGDEFARYGTEWGDTATAVAASTAKTVVWGGTPISFSVEADSVTTAGNASSVGTVTFTVGSQVVKVPLVLEGDLEDPGAAWRLGNPALVFS